MEISESKLPEASDWDFGTLEAEALRQNTYKNLMGFIMP